MENVWNNRLGIFEDGFLARDGELPIFADDKFQAVLNFCLLLNRFGQELAYSEALKIEPGVSFTSYSLFTKLQNTFQAIIYLAKLGMEAEAFSLNRTLLEAVFRLVAISKKGDELTLQLIKDDAFEHGSVAKRILSDAEVMTKISDKRKKELLVQVENMPTPIGNNKKYKPISIFDLAEISELKSLYIYYSRYCSDVHTSLSSLARHHKREGLVTNIEWGPSSVRVKWICQVMIEATLFMLIAYDNLLPLLKMEESRSALELLHRKFNDL